MSSALIRPDGSILEMRGLAADHSNIQCFLKRAPSGAEDIRPLIDVIPSCDPATQKAEAGTLAVFPDRVECAWTTRALTSAETNAPILSQIAQLESTITPRRLREAVLGDRSFLPGIDGQLAALRAQLKK
jgi:hypothetical protein